MNKKVVMVVSTCTMFLALAIPYAGAWDSWGYYTHEKLADDAINAIPQDDYPDICRFAGQLRDGSETEGAHDILKDGIDGKLWAGEADTWWAKVEPETGRKGVLPWYRECDFGKAYLTLGYMVHLLQDEYVPAHETFCAHGYLGHPTDDLEDYVDGAAHYGYLAGNTDWTFTDSKGHVWSYWLDDSMDDDDEDNMSPDPDDETDAAGNPIEDGPDIYFRGKCDWGTYGYGDYVFSFDPLPGKNEGKDYFQQYPNEAIGKEQLKLSYEKTLNEIKIRSEQLPPLIPDDDTHGKPSISARIFGPNKPVDVSFVAMENRKKTVLVSILADAVAIKDTAGKVWDGGADAAYDLETDPKRSSLPWKATITRSWKGDLADGQLADGNYTVKMKVKDQDGNFSEERSRTVKFDKTKPTGTITVKVMP